MKRLATLLCILTLAAVPAFAASDAASTPAPHQFHNKAAFAKSLNLTDEQKAAIQPLRDELKTTTQPLMQQMRQQHAQIHASLEAGADAATIGKQMIAAHALQKQIKAAHDKFNESFSALLTPEQLTKFQALQQQRGSWHRGPGAGAGAPLAQ